MQTVYQYNVELIAYEIIDESKIVFQFRTERALYSVYSSRFTD